MFPTSIRAAGLRVSCSIAVALFGGTAPYLQTFFAERGAPAATWYAPRAGRHLHHHDRDDAETKGRDLADEDEFVTVSAARSEPA